MATYYLSPTDLTFLYQECPRCFYNKVLKIWKRPYTPFPRIFGDIDKCIRRTLHGHSCEFLLNKPGVFDTTNTLIKSGPIQVGDHEIIFSGYPDIRVYFEDGTVGIVDAKTSHPKDSAIKLYDRQLHALRSAIQTPQTGEIKTVSLLGLFIATPTEFILDTTTGASHFQFDSVFKSVEINDGEWFEFLVKVVELLSGKPPDDNGKCHWCVMQRSVAERGATGR
jgi:hypothetical protein